jgi:hypothetical protein
VSTHLREQRMKGSSIPETEIAAPAGPKVART